MSKAPLTPCEHCQRHVRSTETECPFCGKLRSLSSLAPGKPTTARGTSRAAAFAMRAALMAGSASAVGCTASHDPDDSNDGIEAAAGDAGNAHQDAAAKADAAIVDAADAATERDAGIAHPDAGHHDAAIADASTHSDAAVDDDAWVPIAIYGGVFPDPRSRAKV